MASYYPVFLDLTGRSCVIIGGGEVAERKIGTLLECDCRITLISREVTSAIQEWADRGDIIWQSRDYQAGDLKGAFLVIAATDQPHTNQAITREAETERALLNVVDNAPLCTFIAPAIVKRGEVTIAISTGGASPALSRKLREYLERSEIMGYAELAPLLSNARREVKVRGLTVHPNRWQQCINATLVTMVREGREAEALQVLLSGLAKEGEVTA